MGKTSFSKFKKSKGKKFGKLKDKINKLNNPSFEPDERYWTPPERDKTGNAHALIRFLPGIDEDESGEMVPFVTIYDYHFKGKTGNWYIEYSRSTLGGWDDPEAKDPMGDYNSYLWNEVGTEEAKERVRKKHPRRKKYHSNILVLEDPDRPENVGKVFLFAYGQQIMDKIIQSQNPKFEDDEEFNPFDPFEGKNFRLKVTTKGEYANYESSEFSPKTTAIADGDEEKMEEIWDKQYSLLELISDDKFKSYEDLAARFKKVFGQTVDEMMERFDDEDGDDDDESSEFKLTRKNKKEKTLEDELDDEIPNFDDDSSDDVSDDDSSDEDTSSDDEDDDDIDLSFFDDDD